MGAFIGPSIANGTENCEQSGTYTCCVVLDWLVSRWL